MKACKLLNSETADYAGTISERIWADELRRYHISNSLLKRDTDARKALTALCHKAADLALLFGSSNIEYKWEMDPACLPASRDFLPKDHEIVGTKGPDPNVDSDFVVAFIVFGGIVRGEKTSGLLENGRIRLSKTQVVIQHLKS